MKTRNALMFLGFIFVGWVTPQAPAFFSARSADPIKISIAIPSASLDLSDLDVRDRLNRPVQASERKRQLDLLFVSGLNQLLMQNLTPTVRAEKELLSRFWSTLFGVMRSGFRRVFEIVSGVPAQKRFDFSLLATAASAHRSLASPLVRILNFENNHQTNLSSILSSTILLR